MANAENLTSGTRILFRGQEYTVSFTRTYVQTGVEMVRVYLDEKEMPLSVRRTHEFVTV